MKVVVKAWFDHRAWEGEVIGERNRGSDDADYPHMLLVASKSGALWRLSEDCRPVNPNV